MTKQKIINGDIHRTEAERFIKERPRGNPAERSSEYVEGYVDGVMDFANLLDGNFDGVPRK